jgi:predicted short-subunit dehydrogenase-like oxidoreductase (DUF2520 family)
VATTKKGRDRGLSVFVLGAGKVGQGLARALRAKGVPVSVRAARKKLPRSIEATLVVLAVRDGHVGPMAERLVGIVSGKAAVVHVAGALEPDALAALRGSCAGVAQMHPLISFASTRFTPSLEGGNLLVRGDPPAVARARQLARKLGMVARTFRPFDAVAYHAAAGLVANGAAALASVGAQLLEVAGVPPSVAPSLLGPLLASVANNVRALGFPHALTGPVRRGDAAAVEKHLATLSAKLPEAVSLYLAAAAAQLPLAMALGEGPPEGYAAIARLLPDRVRETGTRPST